jgi:molybdate transport system substrate-binding protein
VRRLRAAAACIAALCTADLASAEPDSLRVFAAASLAEPFRALEAAWRGLRADVPLAFQFAASSTLAVQIEEKAPADVVATADEPTMQRLVRGGHVETPRLFARNRLVIAVEPGNPKAVKSLADLARDDLIVVLAAPEVPAGRYARQLLDAAGVAAQPRSLEENVKAVLNKVVLGEADAGIVYASDARSAGDRVVAVEMPEAAQIEVTYWIATLRTASQPASSLAFQDLVTSATGRAALEEAGFRAP